MGVVVAVAVAVVLSSTKFVSGIKSKKLSQLGPVFFTLCHQNDASNKKCDIRFATLQVKLLY